MRIRDFNVGPRAGRLPHTTECAIRARTLSRVVALGTRQVITVYAPFPRPRQSTAIVTSQLKPDDWHAQIGDDTIADAICDRLVHNAHRLKLSGESVRRTKGLTNGKEKGKAR